MYDSHIHLDQYHEDEMNIMLSQIEGVIAVATDLDSSKRLLDLKRQYDINIAAGFHPEQAVLKESELIKLVDWIRQNQTELCAIGEIGLPQYLRREGKVEDEAAYIHILETLIHLASELKLPVVLHAVYADAAIALQLLSKYNVRGHFHWFKAKDELIHEVIEAGHFISVTPDVLWNAKTRRVVELTPLNQLMIETDGPWPHTGFDKCDIQNQLSAIIGEIAVIKQMTRNEVSIQMGHNTRSFYHLEAHDESR
ncbi:TatD family deoxyribonuclease [Macrococcus brunensis]|uniref:TatD family deoxyribonuclease n=1 Tax=Macrococcus brunensis TaxID=198483 RepID=A0A4R6BGP3_9STAP|nr:TatD family hydrolase [Macrococcus brunensis]TDL99012.1 TatD family deoxyribonuclease [Macrococcus brunensis]